MSFSFNSFRPDGTCWVFNFHFFLEEVGRRGFGGVGLCTFVEKITYMLFLCRGSFIC